MVIDLNLQYAIRLLSMQKNDETRLLFSRIFKTDRNEAVKRDIILALARWGDWHWLSDLKVRFRTLSDVERRAFVVASFGLGDEGEHWRRHVKRELGPDEVMVRDWAADKTSDAHWQIPL